MSQFLRCDTRKPDGFYVTFERIETFDDSATPDDYLFQDADYQDEDEARMQAWRDGDWHFIGIQAKADCLLVQNGVGTSYTLTSPGLWAIESDSDESYLQEVYQDEIETLKQDIAKMAAPIYE